jgi:hypothetical protein
LESGDGCSCGRTIVGGLATWRTVACGSDDVTVRVEEDLELFDVYSRGAEFEWDSEETG